VPSEPEPAFLASLPPLETVSPVTPAEAVAVPASPDEIKPVDDALFRPPQPAATPESSPEILPQSDEKISLVSVPQVEKLPEMKIEAPPVIENRPPDLAFRVDQRQPLPQLDLTPEPVDIKPEKAEIPTSITTTKGSPPVVSPTSERAKMDTAEISVFEVFGLPKPSETQEMRAVNIQPEAVIAQPTRPKREHTRAGLRLSLRRRRIKLRPPE
jgi:hypothetical protein